MGLQSETSSGRLHPKSSPPCAKDGALTPLGLPPDAEGALDDAGGGETEEAAEALSGAIAVAADPVPLLVRRGALVAHLGRSREAEQDFRAAVRGNASYWLAYRYLGISRLRAGAGPEAVTVLREAHTLAPQDPETVLYLGEALLSQGEFDEAHARLGQAVTMLPADPRGYTLLGRLFDRLGRKDEAIAMHRRATEASPE
jgi:Flp pilus assembly protein TadD